MWAEAVALSAPEVGPWARADFTFSLSGATLRIKSVLHPELLRLRAARLQKQAKVNFGTQGAREYAKASRWAPRVSRPLKYSKMVAQGFLDDGERENWAAYRELFE